MIRLSKDKVLNEYFINTDGIITDKNGIIQKQELYGGYYCFKGQYVHRILMYTYKGIKDDFDIHHVDENKLNNELNNLIYLTRAEHMSLHRKGTQLSEKTKKKMHENNAKYWNGKYRTAETKIKISESLKGHHHLEETKRKMSEAKKIYWANKRSCKNGNIELQK